MYTPADHTRVHDAIADAEQRTRGEIFCVVAHESGAYREVPLAWAAIVALLLPPLALVLGLRPALLISAVSMVRDNDWVAGQLGSAKGALLAGLIGYALLQLILFAATLAIVSIPGVRRLVTPESLKQARVHARAIEQFSHRLHSATGRTGVLIFASLAERRVEIIGEDEIHAKVGDVVWDQAVAAALAAIKIGDIAGGLVAAVTLCGDALARHFPPDGSPPPKGDVAEI